MVDRQPALAQVSGPPEAGGQKVSLLPSPVLPGLVAAAIAVRLVLYLQNRSLWNDEAALATNIIGRAISELHRPLANEQAAPLGFLYGVKIISLACGTSEYALRLLPLLSGAALLVMAAVFAHRYLGRLHGAFMLLLLAASPMHIYYSAELKQYSTDALAAFALMFACVEVKRSLRRRNLALWMGFAAVAIWFSHPSIFVIAACMVATAVYARAEWCRCAVIWVLGSSLIVTSFLVNYLLITRTTQTSSYLHNFWAGTMRPDGMGTLLPWAAACFRSLLSLLREFAFWQFGLVSMGIGCWLMAARRQGHLVLVCLGPVACAFAAAALRLYPFSGRFLLFAVPGLALVHAAIVTIPGRWWAKSFATVCLLLAISPSLLPVPSLDYPSPVPTRIRDVIESMSQQMKPGDRVFVMGPAHMLFAYYRTRYDFSGQELYMLPLKEANGSDGLAAVLAKSDGRCWVLCANLLGERAKAPALLYERIDQVSPRQCFIEAGSAWAGLYVLPRAASATRPNQ